MKIIVREYPNTIDTDNSKRAEYIEKHGYHFNDKLALRASEMMINSNKRKHTWNSADLRAAMNNMNIKLPDNITIGDVTYLANMAYADFYPEVLNDEAQCFMYAYKVATDPDGYDGMIFRRWLSDVDGKDIKIDWEYFL